MKNILFTLLLLFAAKSFSQVGINNTDPKAVLDITASNASTPNATDGLLIPRIDTFPVTNPGADQNAMIIYLTTTSGLNAPGFYYWNNGTTTWNPLGSALTSSDDFDWFEEGTTTAPDAITDNIYTTGRVAVGHDTADGGRMLVSSQFGDTRFTIEADRTGAFSTANPSFRLRRSFENATNFREARIDLEGNVSGDIVTGSNPNDMLFLSEFADTGFQFLPNAVPTLTINPSGQLSLDSYTTATSYTGTATSILAVDASGNIIQEPLPTGGTTDAWELTGNAGTDEAINFIGTTDARDIMFRRNNVDKMRIDLSWTSFTDEIKIKKSGTAGSNDDLVRLDDSGNSNSGRVTVFNADDVQHYIDGEGAVEFNIQGLDTDFRIESTTNDEAFLLDATNGQIKFGNYGTGAITGTATRSLAVDANGILIEQPLAISNAWNLTGNTGTTSGTDFIGTTDSQDFDVRINNIIYNRFTTEGQLEFLNTGGSVRLGENSGTADDLANRRNILIGDAIAPNVSTGSSAAFDSAYNVGIGYQNLSSLTTGASNIAIGRNTMNSITTQADNIALGRQALEDLVGARNVAVGAYSGLQRASGDLNTFLGYNSNGFGISTGDNNTGIGANSLSRLTSGSNNVAVGPNSGNRLTTGSYNTIIGKSAGMTSSAADGTVSGTVIIGNNAGENNTINNLFMIHNRSTTSTSPRSLLSGIFANTTFNGLNSGPYADNRVGINVDLGANAVNLTHTLTVGGSAKIEDVLNLKPGTAPTTPEEGDVYYDSALKKVRVYTGSVWENLN